MFTVYLSGFYHLQVNEYQGLLISTATLHAQIWWLIPTILISAKHNSIYILHSWYITALDHLHAQCLVKGVNHVWHHHIHLLFPELWCVDLLVGASHVQLCCIDPLVGAKYVLLWCTYLLVGINNIQLQYIDHLVVLDDLLLVTVDHLDWEGTYTWMPVCSSSMDHSVEATPNVESRADIARAWH